MRIVFLGTPEFAVQSLKILVENNYNVVGVVTSPDKPAGRGQKIRESEVKQYAGENNLNILQPTNLKDESFINELKQLSPDLLIVVAFRMLPEVVWNLPKLGTFNLHASLLPNYRGAAPINWAVINGEKETGVTTFFIEHQIDTGNIIMQEKEKINDSESAGELHDKLMITGAKLVLKTVQAIESNSYETTSQKAIIKNNPEIKSAYKIFKEDCKINWNDSIDSIYNKIRGLSPYPTAWAEFSIKDKNVSFKIFSTEKEETEHNKNIPSLHTDKKTFLKIAVNGGFIHLKTLQQAGKKRMVVEDFLRGFQQVVECKIN